MLHARTDYNERIQDSAGLIPQDEPVFLIRACDTLGPETLQAWATAAEAIGVTPDVIAAVRLHARRMVQWQNRHGFKRPDAPPETLIVEGEQE